MLKKNKTETTEAILDRWLIISSPFPLFVVPFISVCMAWLRNTIQKQEKAPAATGHRLRNTFQKQKKRLRQQGIGLEALHNPRELCIMCGSFVYVEVLYNAWKLCILCGSFV